jgi:hypothetical protein
MSYHPWSGDASLLLFLSNKNPSVRGIMINSTKGMSGQEPRIFIKYDDIYHGTYISYYLMAGLPDLHPAVCALHI